MSCIVESPCVHRKDGIYLHAQRCDWFLRCSAGVAYEQPCSTGLHFNRKTNACDYPLDAACPCEYTSLGNLGDSCRPPPTNCLFYFHFHHYVHIIYGEIDQKICWCPLPRGGSRISQRGTNLKGGRVLT